MCFIEYLGIKQSSTIYHCGLESEMKVNWFNVGAAK